MDSSHAPALPRPCGPGLARRTPLEDEGRGRPGPCFASLADVRTGRVGKGGSPPGASRTRPPARRHDPWPRASASTSPCGGVRLKRLRADPAWLPGRARPRQGRVARPRRASDREAEDLETPPCEGGLERRIDPGPLPAEKPRANAPSALARLRLRAAAAEPRSDAAPRSNASGSAPRGRDEAVYSPSRILVKRPVRGHPGSRPAAIRDPQRRRMVMDPGSSLRFGRDDRLLRSAERRVTCAQ